MGLTQWQLALRDSQKPVTVALKKIGFRKTGNYYNRTVQDGLVQVVGFQSGQVTSIFHGNFTVNLGVYVPCIAELEGNAIAGRCVSDARCEIRSRLSDVANLGCDKWWPLDDSSAASGDLIANSLLNHGVPFLDLYTSYSSIMERFQADGTLPFRNSGRSMLAVAIILKAIGDTEKSLEMFDLASKEPTHNRGFSQYVGEIKAKCFS